MDVLHRIAAAWAFGTALILPPQVASAMTPRDVAVHVAEQIAANYFDPAKGAMIAAELKAEAGKGAYDRYDQPLDLARVLTERLKPLDAHFMVAWTPPSAGPPPGPRPRGAVVDDTDAERRTNYGFRAAEVLPGNLGLIELRHFADFAGAGDPARATADAAMALVANTDAVIFDLRDNGGGSPAMVGYLVSHFVPAGADVYNTFKGRGVDASEKPRVEVAGQRRLTVPLYVLISARTGSAAESFAYTLQAAKRAVIVGETSAGAANPGGLTPAGDGFSVFVSGGRPVNPITKTNWEGVGVAPDVAVRAGEALTRARSLALGHAASLPGPTALEKRWALEQLGPAAAVPAATMQEYVGEYGGRAISLADGRLMLLAGRRPALPLKAISADVFAIDDSDAPRRVRFERDQAGRITGLLITFSDGQVSRYARQA
jgi:hypothetical protein